MVINKYDLGWITAFMEFKGVFTVSRVKIKKKIKDGEKIYTYNNPVFYADSQSPVPLETARKILKVGKITRNGAMYRLEVRRKEELFRLIEVLPEELAGPKGEKYMKWRELVLQWKSRGQGEGAVRAAEAF
jgi:hypothetical protein